MVKTIALIVVILAAGLLMINALSKINFKDLSWNKNKNQYPKIIFAVSVILSSLAYLLSKNNRSN